MPYKSVYLTGAPSVGKTTLAQGLMRSHLQVKCFSYGEEMIRHLSGSTIDGATKITVEDLRFEVSRYVSASDVEAVNRDLVRTIEKWRNVGHLIVDAHQVTLGEYGLHCQPFEKVLQEELGFDEIWVLLAPEEVLLARINDSPKGRRIPAEFMARSHNETQLAIASAYAVVWGCQLRAFDATTRPNEILARAIASLEE